MQTRLALRIAAPVLGLGLVLGACSSGSSTTASGGDKTSTTAANSPTTGGASSSGGSSGGSSSGGDSSGSGGTLCTTVTADQAGTLLGEDVIDATDLTVSSRFSSSSNLPGCKYLGQPQGGGEFMVASAEELPCSEADVFLDDPVAKRQPLSGVQDKAVFRPDAAETGMVIDTFAQKGDTCLYVRIFKGTTEAKAAAFTNALLG